MNQPVPTYLANSSILSVVIMDIEGYYRYANSAFYTQFPFLCNPVDGLHYKQSIHSADWDALTDAARYCIENPGKSAHLQLRKATPEMAEYNYSHWEISAHLNESGESTGFLCIGYDLGVLNKSLYDSENKLRALLNSTSDSNVLLDLDKRLISFNTVADAYARKYQNQTYQVGEYYEKYVLPDFRSAFHANFDAAANGSTVTFELEVNFGDRLGWFFMKYVPVYDENKKLIGVSYSVSDITDRKNHEQRIMEQNTLLRQIAWEQSHTVRKPLCNLMSIIDLLIEEPPQSSHTLYLEALRNEAIKLDKIIKGIVDLTDDTK
ncbi:MAG: PAS domain-containing protein [Bacteroidetes bacterium]|nr:PAS domain-containing protein [Bacteroidota bacterium]MCH8524730.1 PAS domain-containing protein [Balneolales bacterium]